MTEQHMPSTQAAASPEGPTVSNAAVGPLTVRDLVVLGSVAIIFIASVVPIIVTLAGSLNLWNTSGLFYIGVGVVLPLVVGGLFLARRLNPASKVRIGSLSIDQFASVVAAFAVFFFFTGTVTNFRIAFLVGLIGSLLLLVATVCAQWVPFLASDFAGRAEAPAHVAARDAAPAAKRPAAPKPVGAMQTGAAPVSAAQSGAAQAAQGQNVPVQAAADAQTGARSAGQTPAGHTSAGQIFTPANTSNPAAHAGSAQAGSGQARTSQAPAAQAAAAAASGLSGAESGAAAGTGSTATQSASGQSAAAADAASAGATSDGAAPAAAQSGVQAEESRPTGADAAAPSVAASATPASTDQGVSGSSDDAAATTLNPQVAQPAGDNAATAAAATSRAATNTSAKDSAAKDQAARDAAASPAKESIAATVNPKAGAVRVIAEPFWFAVDRPQNVIDEKTRQFIFKLTPGAWILALEDRGNSFLVQDSHGKTGVLLDLLGIERASDSQ